MEYEGAVWYEKDFYFAGGTARLVFEAVMTECKVWLDGEYLGYHYGGFCQFDFIIPSLSPGIHKLTVKADNRFNEISIPQTEVDWYHYGGITRSVSVETLTGTAITYGKCDYILHDDFQSAEVYFTAELYNAGESTQTTLCISLDGKTVYTQKVAIAQGAYKTVVFDTIRLDNIKLWEPGTPYLYEMAFHTETDDLIDRIGFRHVEIQDKTLLLNGKSIALYGVNRHEDHPDFGMTFPSFLMKRDMDIIEDLGCNSVRGSHFFHRCSYIIGFYPWQFCDMRSAKDLAKTRTLNNKGILNEYRKTKQAYFTVKNCYSEFKSKGNGS